VLSTDSIYSVKASRQLQRALPAVQRRIQRWTGSASPSSSANRPDVIHRGSWASAVAQFGFIG
jgi:hypothetical protein